MHKIIVTAILVVSLLAMFASCTSGGNVDSSNGEVSSMDQSSGMTGTSSGSATGNGTGSGSDMESGTNSGSGIVGGAESALSNVINDANSIT